MRVLEIIAALILVLFLSWYSFEDYWYRQFVPDNIGLSHRVSITSSSGLREGCGVAIYRLSDATYKRIISEGLRYFEQSTQARGHSGWNYKYSKWKETPRSGWTRPENWSYELLCGGNLNQELYQDIVSAGKSSGSYYSKKHEAVLMVIPSQKLVVFAHNG